MQSHSELLGGLVWVVAMLCLTALALAPAAVVGGFFTAQSDVLRLAVTMAVWALGAGLAAVISALIILRRDSYADRSVWPVIAMGSIAAAAVQAGLVAWAEARFGFDWEVDYIGPTFVLPILVVVLTAGAAGAAATRGAARRLGLGVSGLAGAGIAGLAVLNLPRDPWSIGEVSWGLASAFAVAVLFSGAVVVLLRQARSNT